jgi:hypothetical protein
MVPGLPDPVDWLTMWGAKIRRWEERPAERFVHAGASWKRIDVIRSVEEYGDMLMATVCELRAEYLQLLVVFARGDALVYAQEAEERAKTRRLRLELPPSFAEVR